MEKDGWSWGAGQTSIYYPESCFHRHIIDKHLRKKIKKNFQVPLEPVCPSDGHTHVHPPRLFFELLLDLPEPLQKRAA